MSDLEALLKEQDDRRRQERLAVDAFLTALPFTDGGDAARKAFARLYAPPGGMFPWEIIFKRVQGVSASLEFRKDFLDVWVCNGDDIRDAVYNDLDLIKGLRCLLPAYTGAAMTLYRGASFGERKYRRYGCSWSSSKDVAYDFAAGHWWLVSPSR